MDRMEEIRGWCQTVLILNTLFFCLDKTGDGVMKEVPFTAAYESGRIIQISSTI